MSGIDVDRMSIETHRLEEIVTWEFVEFDDRSTSSRNVSVLSERKIEKCQRERARLAIENKGNKGILQDVTMSDGMRLQFVGQPEVSG